jgi:hypothetical protein
MPKSLFPDDDEQIVDRYYNLNINFTGEEYCITS